DELFKAIDEMKQMGCNCRLLYMDATVETIVMRYKETRRRHPLDPEGGKLEEAVNREIEMLKPVKKRADFIINTTNLTLGQLQRKMYNMFFGDYADKSINVNVMSFGFKYGIPIEADMLIDVRFLPNPYYVTDLRTRNGLDKAVSDYVFSNGTAREFMDKFRDMLAFMLPHYVEEGKTSLTICIGCTGGKHRSVAVTEQLREIVADIGYPVECIHRDIKRDTKE
ncbi:MAG: RNase adapter RapZ, partial [Oscillospiraceae bacterium]|nr:RNase adapter RapZ [Oscillospiraceae bacterium]